LPPFFLGFKISTKLTSLGAGLAFFSCRLWFPRQLQSRFVESRHDDDTTGFMARTLYPFCVGGHCVTVCMYLLVVRQRANWQTLIYSWRILAYRRIHS
jgi:hypothetical protein